MRGFFYLAISIALSALPVFLCFLWLRRKRPAMIPLPFLLSLAAGVFSLIPAALLQYALKPGVASGLAAIPYQIFVRIALTEELGRLLFLAPLFALILRRPAVLGYQSVGAAEGLVAGFAFAMAETLSYAVMEPDAALTRILTAAPLHGACGSRVGMAASSLSSAPGKSAFRFFSAVAIHGIYNSMLVLPAFSPVFPVILAMLALGSSVAVIRAEGWE